MSGFCPALHHPHSTPELSGDKGGLLVPAALCNLRAQAVSQLSWPHLWTRPCPWAVHQESVWAFYPVISLPVNWTLLFLFPPSPHLCCHLIPVSERTQCVPRPGIQLKKDIPWDQTQKYFIVRESVTWKIGRNGYSSIIGYRMLPGEGRGGTHSSGLALPFSRCMEMTTPLLSTTRRFHLMGHQDDKSFLKRF